MMIWNQPLHGWSWPVIAKVFKLVDKLISLSQALVPHKMLLTALVRRRLSVSLPMDIDFSFGMHSYKILIIEDRGKFPKFWHERGRFILPDPFPNEEEGRGLLKRSEGGVRTEDQPAPAAEKRYMHKVTREEKGKGKANLAPVSGQGQKTGTGV